MVATRREDTKKSRKIFNAEAQEMGRVQRNHFLRVNNQEQDSLCDLNVLASLR